MKEEHRRQYYRNLTIQMTAKEEASCKYMTFLMAVNVFFYVFLLLVIDSALFRHIKEEKEERLEAKISQISRDERLLMK